MASSLRRALSAAFIALASSAATLSAAQLEPRLMLTGSRPTGHGHHPHMEAAEAQLREAELELGHADSDYGGHRTKAMELVHEALREVWSAYTYGGAAHEGPVIPR